MARGSLPRAEVAEDFTLQPCCITALRLIGGCAFSTFHSVLLCAVLSSAMLCCAVLCCAMSPCSSIPNRQLHRPSPGLRAQSCHTRHPVQSTGETQEVKENTTAPNPKREPYSCVVTCHPPPQPINRTSQSINRKSHSPSQPNPDQGKARQGKVKARIHPRPRTKYSPVWRPALSGNEPSCYATHSLAHSLTHLHTRLYSRTVSRWHLRDCPVGLDTGRGTLTTWTPRHLSRAVLVRGSNGAASEVGAWLLRGLGWGGVVLLLGKLSALSSIRGCSVRGFHDWGELTARRWSG